MVGLEVIPLSLLYTPRWMFTCLRIPACSAILSS